MIFLPRRREGREERIFFLRRVDPSEMKRDFTGQAPEKKASALRRTELHSDSDEGSFIRAIHHILMKFFLSVLCVLSEAGGSNIGGRMPEISM